MIYIIIGLYPKTLKEQKYVFVKVKISKEILEKKWKIEE